MPSTRPAPLSLLSLLLMLPRATWVFLSTNHTRLFQEWVVVPMVILAILVFVWAVNLALVHLPFTFPPSVACMIIAFLALSLSSVVLGRRRTAVALRYLEPTSEFLLKWIAILFCPSFILLPVEEKGTRIGKLEIIKIVIIFLAGFVVFIVLAWSVVTVFKFISPFKKPDRTDPETDEQQPRALHDPIELAAIGESTVLTSSGAESVMAPPPPAVLKPEGSHTQTEGSVVPSLETSTTLVHAHTQAPSGADSATEGEVPSREPSITTLAPASSIPSLVLTPSINSHLPTPLDHLIGTVDRLFPVGVYTILFLASLPIFYTTAQSLPLFLSLNVLAYLFGAQAVPPRVRRVVHPILTCSFLTILGIWALGAMRGWPLERSLNAYSTGSRYLVLFNPHKTGPVPLPGAGDVLVSVLDASIVSLAVPMYRYRAELKRYWFEMFSTIVPLSLLSLFIYPLICRAVRLEPSRALAFAARSVTTPMAIPMEATLKGDSGLTVILCILTGVLGAIAGPQLLRLLRVPDSDFLTIGVVLGCTASAISTAALLGTNRARAAISSLSFVIYGICCIVLTSIPPVVHILQTLAGL